jgi:amino acid transporter
VQWIVSEAILVLAIGMNYLNPKTYKWIFRIATAIIILDFALNIIWFPIAVSQTYGFQSAKFAFTGTENLTGAPPVWNWMLVGDTIRIAFIPKKHANCTPVLLCHCWPARRV